MICVMFAIVLVSIVCGSFVGDPMRDGPKRRKLKGMGTRAPLAERPFEFSVMTFNVWRALYHREQQEYPDQQPWGDAPEQGTRKAVQLEFFGDSVRDGEWAAEHGITDVFGLQECTNTMMPDIKTQLTGYIAPFEYSLENPNQVFVRAEAFKVVAKQSYTLLNGTRYVSLLRLRVRAGEQAEFVLANTHLTSQGNRHSWANPGPSPRALEIAHVADLVLQMVGEDDVPVIVMGDMNDIYAPLRVAFELLGVTPSFGQLPSPIRAPHTCPTPMMDVRNENDNWGAKTYDLLLSKGLEVKSTKRLEYQKKGMFPSDHYPVQARYQLKPRPVQTENIAITELMLKLETTT